MHNRSAQPVGTSRRPSLKPVMQPWQSPPAPDVHGRIGPFLIQPPPRTGVPGTIPGGVPALLRHQPIIRGGCLQHPSRTREVGGGWSLRRACPGLLSPSVFRQSGGRMSAGCFTPGQLSRTPVFPGGMRFRPPPFALALRLERSSGASPRGQVRLLQVADNCPLRNAEDGGQVFGFWPMTDRLATAWRRCCTRTASSAVLQPRRRRWTAESLLSAGSPR